MRLFRVERCGCVCLLDLCAFVQYATNVVVCVCVSAAG